MRDSESAIKLRLLSETIFRNPMEKASSNADIPAMWMFVGILRVIKKDEYTVKKAKKRGRTLSARVMFPIANPSAANSWTYNWG